MMQFEQFASSVAKVAEKTRQDGSTIGNAYKVCTLGGIMHKPSKKILTNWLGNPVVGWQGGRNKKCI